MILHVSRSAPRILVALAAALAVGCSESGSTGSGNAEGNANAEGDTPSAPDEENDDPFPLFGLERGEICAAHCARSRECNPDNWQDGIDDERCVPDCQTTLDDAWANERRPDCGRAIDSLYACGTTSCAEFEALRVPSISPETCAEVEQRFREICLL